MFGSDRSNSDRKLLKAAIFSLSISSYKICVLCVYKLAMRPNRVEFIIWVSVQCRPNIYDAAVVY